MSENLNILNISNIRIEMLKHLTSSHFTDMFDFGYLLGKIIKEYIIFDKNKITSNIKGDIISMPIKKFIFIILNSETFNFNELLHPYIHKIFSELIETSNDSKEYKKTLKYFERLRSTLKNYEHNIYLNKCVNGFTSYLMLDIDF